MFVKALEKKHRLRKRGKHVADDITRKMFRRTILLAQAMNNKTTLLPRELALQFW